MAHLEIKKMKQGMSYSCKEKTIILNVFKYFKMQFPDLCVTEIVRRTAKATGCSEKSIFQFRKEEASGEGFREPSKTKIRKNININSRDMKYDQTVRQAIRNIIYDLKYKNIVPSLSTILKNINENNQLPNFSLMTLRRLLFDMGFCYEKNGAKSILVEKPVGKSASAKTGANKRTPVTQPSLLSPKQETVNIPKPMPHIPPENNVNQSNNMSVRMNPQMDHQTSQRLLPPMPHYDNHMVSLGPPPHHMNSMMLNHRMPPPHHNMAAPHWDPHIRREQFIIGS